MPFITDLYQPAASHTQASPFRHTRRGQAKISKHGIQRGVQDALCKGRQGGASKEALALSCTYTYFIVCLCGTVQLITQLDICKSSSLQDTVLVVKTKP